MQAVEILKRLPQELFPADRDVNTSFKGLAKIWHPDHSKDPLASNVFSHLQRCRDYLVKGAAKSVDLHDTVTGKTQRYSYLSEHRLSDCKVLVGVSTVSFLLTGVMRDQGREVCKRPWEFRDDRQKAEMSRWLPTHTKLIEAREGLLVSYRRQPGDVLLSDLLAYHAARKERVPPLAVMWMVSGLLNIACYLEVTKAAHCAFREEFVTVNPDQHETKLVGPALFASAIPGRPKYALAETLRDFPTLRTKDYQIKDSRLDLTLIRSLVLRLLGHRTLRAVREDRDVPAGLLKWLESPAPTSAISDYVAWEKLRGERKFHVYGSTARDVYVSLI